MPAQRCRSVFLSDVHLGTPDCKADYLLDFLRHLTCQRLFLVGDIVDLQALRRRRHWPASHAAVVARLLAMARDGIEVIYIPGNHDAALRGLAGQAVAGIQVQLEAVHVAADGRRYLVTHGDAFDPEHAGPAWMLVLGEALHGLLCWGNRRMHGLRRRLALPYLPLSIVLKSRLKAVLGYIDGFAGRVAAEARRRGLDGCICGHIHYGQARDLGGVLYLNDGDWVEHCTALVERMDGSMELLHWCEQPVVLAHAGRSRPVPLMSRPLALAPLARAGAARREAA